MLFHLMLFHMAETKEQLQKKYDALHKKALEAGIIEKNPTLVETISAIESDAMVEVTEIITMCEKETGRKFPSSSSLPVNCDIITDLESRRANLKETVQQLTKYAYSYYNFADSYSFRKWAGDIVSREWGKTHKKRPQL